MYNIYMYAFNHWLLVCVIQMHMHTFKNEEFHHSYKRSLAYTQLATINTLR